MIRSKNKELIAFLCCVLLIAAACTNQNTETEEENHFKNVSGEAQGTTYSITYLDSIGGVFSKQEADSILDAIDMALSVWVQESTISKFNNADSMKIDDPHFLNVFFRGREIVNLTDGAFQPMVMPLVRAWGFGPTGAHPKGDLNTDTLMVLVNTELEITPVDTSSEGNLPAFLIQKMLGQEIDVNGIAQGYSVDVIADFLKSKGVENFMVEIGGEVFAYGVNNADEPWRIGIDKPVPLDQQRELQAIAKLTNRAIATSGSYRKFYEVDGKRYSHTIDPATGKPVDHQLLSATVMAPNCTNADAFATAFMVKGFEASKKYVEDHPELNLEIYLIYNDESEGFKSYMSPGMKEKIEEI